MSVETPRHIEAIEDDTKILQEASYQIMQKVCVIWGYFSIDLDPNVCLVDSLDNIVFIHEEYHREGTPNFAEIARERAEKAVKGERIVGGRKIKFGRRVIGAIGIAGMKDWRDQLIVDTGFDLFESKQHGIVPRGWITLTQFNHPNYERAHWRIIERIERAKNENWGEEIL